MEEMLSCYFLLCFAFCFYHTEGTTKSKNMNIYHNIELKTNVNHLD